jgi:HEAT repeat protein
MTYDNEDYFKHSNILGGFGAAGIPILLQRLYASERLANQYFAAEAAWFALGMNEEEKGNPEHLEAIQREYSALRPSMQRRKWRVHEAIIQGLAAAGESDLTALREALRLENAHVRAGVASALGLLGKNAQSAVPDLVEALSDQDHAVRIEAAAALEKIDIRIARQAGVKQVPDVLR